MDLSNDMPRIKIQERVGETFESYSVQQQQQQQQRSVISLRKNPGAAKLYTYIYICRSLPSSKKMDFHIHLDDAFPKLPSLDFLCPPSYGLYLNLLLVAP